MLRCSNYMLVVVVVALGAAVGCNQKAEAAGGPEQSQPAQSANAAPKKSAVARLVFLDKAEACECTQKTINKGWTALQAALGSGNPLPVDRIHVDTQGDQAAPLLAQRKIVAVPALYVLDANGNVLEMLQGELEEAEVRRAMR